MFSFYLRVPVRLKDTARWATTDNVTSLIACAWTNLKNIIGDSGKGDPMFVDDQSMAFLKFVQRTRKTRNVFFMKAPRRFIK